MPIEMTMRQMTNAWTALQSIQKYPKVVREGGQERAERVHCKFSPATRKLIRRQFKSMRPLIEDYNDDREDAIADVTGGLAAIPALNERSTQDEQREVLQMARKLSKQLRSILDAKHQIDVEPLSEADLRLDENPITGEDLDLLGPLYVPNDEVSATRSETGSPDKD
jgi:hypothetical protein